MPKYTYTAISTTGEKTKGEHISPDESGVLNMLQSRGYYATKISKKSNIDLNNITIGSRKLPVHVVARFSTQLASMLRAGVPIARSIEILQSEVEHKPLVPVLDDIYKSITEGNSLSTAVRPFEGRFPVLFMSMVEAGESSGTLDSCLDRAASAFTRTAKLNTRIRNAMIYPAIILFFLVALLLVMLIVVVPQFMEIYGDEPLPAFTQFLLNVSYFLRTQWFIWISVLVAVIAGISVFLRTDFGRTGFAKFRLNMPAIGRLVRKVYAARFARTLASLVATGVNLPEALSISGRSVLNYYLEKEIQKMVDDVVRGEQLSDSLEKMGHLPSMLARVTRIGEESGRLEDMLLQLADYYDDESEAATQAMLTMLEPALIVVMAIIVLPVLLGILAPMFGMMEMMM